jgi:hypothetical protein
VPQPRPGLPKPRFSDVLDDVLGLNLGLVMFWVDVLGDVFDVLGDVLVMFFDVL